jgi:4-amino-4-deoxy-L-arabinose transferase-like glycosyltransferase
LAIGSRQLQIGNRKSSIAHWQSSIAWLVIPIFAVLLLLHLPLLRLPYFWDEAGYYIPAALDFYHHALLIPLSAVPSGHTPLIMIYLGVVWHLFGFSPVTTRAAMLLIAAATVLATYALAREVCSRETALWSALLLVLSPLFFAQSSLVFLDMAAACFTLLAVFFLLRERWGLFALSGIAAVMSKETAVVMLPAMWSFVLLQRRERRFAAWAALVSPAIALGIWAVHYHHVTGFWTGNPQYLRYNLYSALTPLHILRALLARICEVVIQGFNWLLAAGALAGIRRATNQKAAGSRCGALGPTSIGTSEEVLLPSRDREGATSRINGVGRNAVWYDFKPLAITLIAAYTLLLGFVGGAVLSRYMLPVLPIFVILALGFICYLPVFPRRAIIAAAAACFVASWFLNPPYPFPYENNLAYADFIRLHQEAANFLQSIRGSPVILTAWPATDELRQPLLGYVRRPLRVAQVESFAASAFVAPPRFDILYIYSRKWQPKHNVFSIFRPARPLLERFYDYRSAVSVETLAVQYRLKLLRFYERRGQWVRIYAGSGGHRRAH